MNQKQLDEKEFELVSLLIVIVDKAVALRKLISRDDHWCMETCEKCRVRNAVRCVNCHSKLTFKIEWPSDEVLHSMLWSFPTEKVASQLGVSDSAIGKRCRQRNISKPPKGYWTKVYCGIV